MWNRHWFERSCFINKQTKNCGGSNSADWQVPCNLFIKLVPYEYQWHRHSSKILKNHTQVQKYRNILTLLYPFLVLKFKLYWKKKPFKDILRKMRVPRYIYYSEVRKLGKPRHRGIYTFKIWWKCESKSTTWVYIMIQTLLGAYKSNQFSHYYFVSLLNVILLTCQSKFEIHDITR